MYGKLADVRVLYLREIDAQKHLLSLAEKYKIPVKEQEATKRALRYYENKLKEHKRDGWHE